MKRLHIDIETYSEADLKKEGGYRYALHPSTDLNIVCFAVGNGPVHVWWPWKKVPNALFKALEDHPEMQKGGKLFMGRMIPKPLDVALRKCQKSAHNAQFERIALNGTAGQKHDVPHIPIKETHCTMAKAVVHGLPEALEHCASALGTHPKSKDGANEMRYLAKPRQDGTRPTIYDEQKRFISATKYCIDDVLAERDIDNNVPDLTKREEQVYFLDQRINERGIYIDQENIENARVIVEQYKKKLARLCRKHTGVRPSQTAALSAWIRENGYPQLKDLQAATVVEAQSDPECPPNVKKILKLYSSHNMKAVSKLDAMQRAVCPDGRLHGMLHYYGAGPGRWSSRIVQLQNLLRPLIKNVDDVIDAMWLQDLDEVRAMHPLLDLMKIIASCIRGMLIAAPGKKLVAYDFAQIESRIQAWLSNAKWKLDFFKSDSEFKVYHITGSMMFGKPAEEIVDKGEEQLYTTSKIGELACGFQAEQVKTWSRLEDAARFAVKNPGKAYAIPSKLIMFKVVGRWLYMRLPSGRRIAYLDPKVIHDQVTYMGTHTKTRRWTRVETYGGKLLNNACEGIGRDLLVNGLFNMEEAGYETVLTVHDEGVFEVDEDFGSEEEAEQLMTVPLKWAEGLPIKCSGWTAKRYRK
jgi:DNA polymerase